MQFLKDIYVSRSCLFPFFESLISFIKYILYCNHNLSPNQPRIRSQREYSQNILAESNIRALSLFKTIIRQSVLEASHRCPNQIILLNRIEYTGCIRLPGCGREKTRLEGVGILGKRVGESGWATPQRGINRDNHSTECLVNVFASPKASSRSFE